MSFLLNGFLGAIGQADAFHHSGDGDYATVHGTPEHANVWGQAPHNVFGTAEGTNVFGVAPQDIWGRPIG